MYTILFVIFLWYAGLFFQTFFLHRYAAHQSFEMLPLGEKICFFLTWLTQGSNYLSAYGYGVMHRMHHAYADTDKDPHSPKYDPNPFAMMWRTKNIYAQITAKKIPVEEKFTKNVPQWEAFDKFASSWISRIMWGVIYTVIFYLLAEHWWEWLLLPVAFMMAPIHGMIINWFSHIYGYRNFDVKDTSTNMLPVDFLMLGEAYHNNHHKHGGRPNFGGVRWHEIDPTYQVMKVLHALGWIRLKSFPKVVREM